MTVHTRFVTDKTLEVSAVHSCSTGGACDICHDQLNIFGATAARRSVTGLGAGCSWYWMDVVEGWQPLKTTMLAAEFLQSVPSGMAWLGA